MMTFLCSVTSVVVAGPGVGAVHHGTGAEDGLALVGQVGHVGELVAVELKHSAEGGLLAPLALQAVLDVPGVGEQEVNLGLVNESSTRVGGDLGFVLSNLNLVLLEVGLGLGNLLGQLKNLETEGLNGNNLVGVDVNLLLVALLVGELGVQVEVVHSLVVVLRHNGAIVGGGGGGGAGLSSCFSLGSSVGVHFNGSGSVCEHGEGSNKFHDFLVY